MIPTIPSIKLIPLDSIKGESTYKDLRILRAQTDQEAATNYLERLYQFQHDPDYTIIEATLTRKGMIGDQVCVSAITHPSLKQFVNMSRTTPRIHLRTTMKHSA